MLSQIIATAGAGIFAGAAVYINVVQHPAAAQLGTATPVRFFGPMYSRAAPMQASLALVGALAGLWTWWTGSGGLWLLGAVLLGFVIPFTLLAIMPTNNRLTDDDLDPSSAEAAALLDRWSRLHGVRSLASVVAFLLFLVALIGS